jgi:hypothetical protein
MVGGPFGAPIAGNDLLGGESSLIGDNAQAAPTGGAGVGGGLFKELPALKVLDPALMRKPEFQKIKSE